MAAGRRMGHSQSDFELQQRNQIEMIANVFFNMLNQMSTKEKDPRYAEMAESVKHMLQTRQFDNLLGPKVPMPSKGNVINLLKVNDLPAEDYA